jgi:hypothetical protein
MSDTLRSAQPPIYKALLGEIFDEPAVKEARATCENCEMCDKGTMPPAVNAVFFDKDIKCCSYFPSLPNYLVGSILEDEEFAEGARRVKKIIASKIGVTPYWVGPSNKWELLYNASSASAFGRAPSLRCPYYDNGRCSIWRHRETVCSTFYCKFVYGANGSLFWKSLKTYFCYVEEMLAAYAARSVCPDIKEPPNTSKLTMQELEDLPPLDTAYKSWWRDWAGREEEFYKACAAKVRAMTREEFKRIIDDQGRGKQLLRDATEKYKALTTQKIPERASLNTKMRSLPVTNGFVVTTPYNPYDSRFVEGELWEVLRKFTFDNTVAEVRDKLAKDEGIEFEDALLHELTLHGILIPPPAGWEAGKCETGAAPFKPLLSTARFRAK